MKAWIRYGLFAAIFIISWTATASGANEQTQNSPRLLDIALWLLPFAMVGGVLWFYLKSMNRTPLARRQLEYFERSEQHMHRVEQALDRIATALEKRG